MARDDKIAKGGAAQRLLEDPLLQEAFGAVERDIVDALAAMQLDGAEQSQRALELVHDLQANRRYQAKMYSYVRGGVIEARSQDGKALRTQAVKDPRWT